MFRVIVAVLGAAIATVLRRISKGPGLPGWSVSTELIRATQRAALDVLAKMDPPAARRIMDAAGARRRDDGRVTERRNSIGGVPTSSFESTVDSGSGATVLYFHGGGYVVGSAKMLSAFTAEIADGIAGRVVSADYRLSPEHTYPAALEDAIAVYRGLVASEIAPSRIVIAGDSAGGNLCAALLLALRDAGEALPAAAVLLCPWVDLANQGDSFRRNDATDTLSFEAAEIWSAMYRGERSAKDPAVSPLQADLAGLPPLLVIAGEAEVLIDPIEAFSERARDAGVEIEFEVVPEMFHDWMMVASVPQSKPTLDRICAFVRARAGDGSSA
jgi:acetyl esterase/lipase